MEQPSNDMNAFREALGSARSIVVLSGAGISAESGVPTFRGAGGFWRTYKAEQLATPEAFEANPSLVWEFYHYRREVMRSKEPNAGHKAIAELEARLIPQGRKVTVITQNIDRLHHRAGSKSIIELHDLTRSCISPSAASVGLGSLFATRCTKCGMVEENTSSPLVPALEGKGAPDPNTMEANIPLAELPRCSNQVCSGLLRPHVVWFGEELDEAVLKASSEALLTCDLCLLVGTSSVVYPAAGFAPIVAARGVPVAEFNLEQTPVTSLLRFHFEGKSGDLLPGALARHPSEPC